MSAPGVKADIRRVNQKHSMAVGRAPAEICRKQAFTGCCSDVRLPLKNRHSNEFSSPTVFAEVTTLLELGGCPV